MHLARARGQPATADIQPSRRVALLTDIVVSFPLTFPCRSTKRRSSVSNTVSIPDVVILLRSAMSLVSSSSCATVVSSARQRGDWSPSCPGSLGAPSGGSRWRASSDVAESPKGWRPGQAGWSVIRLRLQAGSHRGFPHPPGWRDTRVAGPVLPPARPDAAGGSSEPVIPPAAYPAPPRPEGTDHPA